MATQLNQTLTFTDVAGGGTVALAHNINVNGIRQIPDRLFANVGGFDITASSTTVTVTNQGDAPATCVVWAEYLYSTSRAFGSADVKQLTPAPFVVAGGSGVASVMPYVSVADYGVLPGVVDYTQLNAAVAAAVAQQKPLYFPPGRYVLPRFSTQAYSWDLAASDLTIIGSPGYSVLAQPAGMPDASVSILRINDQSNVVLRDLVFDGNWGNSASTISYLSSFATLPQTTINLESTAGFPESGSVKIITPTGPQTVTYTGKTATSLTGCAGGTGVIMIGYAVGWSDSQAGINQTTQTDPKNHAIMLRGSHHIRVENCRFQGVYGDCIWMGNSADDDVFNWTTDVQVIGCDGDMIARNAISFGAGAERIKIDRCTFTRFFTTGVDSEPQEYYTATRNITILNSNFEGWWDPDFQLCIIMSIVGAIPNGYNQTSSARGWRVDNCVFKNGGIHVNTAIDIVITNNRIVIDKAGTSAWSPIFIDHSVDDYEIVGNYIYNNQLKPVESGFSNNGCIQVQFYALSSTAVIQPTGGRIVGNKIHARKGVHGVYVDGPGGFAIGDGTAIVPPVSGVATLIQDGTLASGNPLANKTNTSILTLAGAGWTVNQWVGRQVLCGGAVALIASNDTDTLILQTGTVVDPFAPIPKAWRTALGDLAPTPAAGAFIITSLAGLVDISDNQIDCGSDTDPNPKGGYGIFLFNDRAGSRIRVANNTIKNPTSWGIHVQSATSKPPLSVEIVDNKGWNDQVTATMSSLIRFFDVQSLTAIGKLVMRGNSTLGGSGSATMLSTGNLAAGCRWIVIDGPTQQWAGLGDPAGSLAAPISSTYARLDGGASTAFYVQENVSLTGWIGK